MGILLTTSLLFVHLHVYMSKLKIKLTKLWTGLAGNYTKNLGDFLSSLTTGDSNTNPYWKIERKKGRTISSLHLQCHKLTTSLSLSLSSNGLFCGKLLLFTLSPLPISLSFFFCFSTHVLVFLHKKCRDEEEEHCSNGFYAPWGPKPQCSLKEEGDSVCGYYGSSLIATQG